MNDCTAYAVVMRVGHRTGVALALTSLLAISCADFLKLSDYRQDDSATGGGGAGQGGGATEGGGSGGVGGVGGDGGDGGSAIDCNDWEPDMYTSQYHCEVLKDRPASYWRLGEATQLTDMEDQGSGSRTGTRVGDVVQAEESAIPGDPDKASRFDGGRIDVGDFYDFEGRVPYSVECWVMPEQENAYMAIVDNIDSMPAVDNGWALGISGDNRVSWSRLVGMSADNSVLRFDPLPLDAFTHLVVVYNGTNLLAYVNGVLSAGPLAHQLDIVADPVLLTIGGVSPAFGPFRGVIDEVAIYDRVLSTERIEAHYAAVFP